MCIVTHMYVHMSIDISEHVYTHTKYTHTHTHAHTHTRTHTQVVIFNFYAQTMPRKFLVDTTYIHMYVLCKAAGN